jgi:hypothetical protein
MDDSEKFEEIHFLDLSVLDLALPNPIIHELLDIVPTGADFISLFFLSAVYIDALFERRVLLSQRGHASECALEKMISLLFVVSCGEVLTIQLLVNSEVPFQVFDKFLFVLENLEKAILPQTRRSDISLVGIEKFCR